METYPFPAEKTFGLPHCNLAECTPSASLAVFLINFRGNIAQMNSAGQAALDLNLRHVKDNKNTFYGRFMTVADGCPDRTGSAPNSDPIIRCLAYGEHCLRVVGTLGNERQRFSFEGSVASVHYKAGGIQGALLVATLRPFRISPGFLVLSVADTPSRLLNQAPVADPAPVRQPRRRPDSARAPAR